MDLREKEMRLRNYIRSLNSVVVAFSGGVDSSLVLKVALEELGRDKVLAVIGSSKTYPEAEIEEATRIAYGLGANYSVIETEELANENFRENPPERCFYCKSELFLKLTEIAKNENYKHVLEGSNADDESDWRPGSKAVTDFKVISPLKESALKKSEVRELAKRLGLENWNKPSFACLSSRFPYGQSIEEDKLLMIEKAEAFIRAQDIEQVRVRIDKHSARIEVLPADFEVIIDKSSLISDYLRKLGFIYISLDLQGYKSGSLNKVLPRLKEVING